MGTAGILMCVLLLAPPEKVNLRYPKENGTVFAIPRVILILEGDPESARIEIDGREVPKDAVQGCAICAGSRPAVMTHLVPWAAADGEHTAAIIGDETRIERRYTVDSAVPSLSGLTGFIDFPDAQVASSRSLRGGMISNAVRKHDIHFWAAATRLFEEDPGNPLARPFEAGATAEFPDEGDQEVEYSLKVSLLEQTPQRPSVAAGVRENDPFAAVGWHTDPSWFNFSIGAGGRDLPGGFAGAGWGPQMFRLVAEYGTDGQFNYGAVLTHAYGLRAGIYRVEGPDEDTRWSVQLSASLQF